MTVQVTSLPSPTERHVFRVKVVRRTLADCFKPEFRHFADVFRSAITRNPDGWELWLAMKQDANDGRDPA